MYNNFCNSCGMPLTPETAGGEHKVTGNFCQYCTDESGNLYPKEIVKKGIVEFLAGWAPEKDGIDFEQRAEHYLQAMPAWSGK